MILRNINTSDRMSIFVDSHINFYYRIYILANKYAF
jgi:hypothetical protein